MQEHARQSKIGLTKWLPYAFLFFFIGICLYIFKRDLERIEWSSLPARPDLYALVAMLSLTSYVIRALRWWVYLRQVEIRIPLGYCIVTYFAGFAYTLAPGKVGELLKYRYYRPMGVAFTPVAAAYIVERLTDLIVFVSIAFFFWGASMHGYGLVILISGLGALAALFFFKRTRALEGKWLTQAFFRRNEGVARLLTHFNLGIESSQRLLTLPRLILGFGFGCLGWLFECTTLYVLSGAFLDAEMSIAVALGIYAVAVVVGAVSFFPGGLGGTEAAMVALLMLNGYGFQESAMLTVVCRLLTLWIAIPAGWLAVYKLHRDTVTRNINL